MGDYYDRYFGPKRVATPESLSPEARKLYTDSVEQRGEAASRIWLEYRDYYVMDADMNAVAVPFVEWTLYFEKREERQIRRDHIGNWFISTVFLGLDHGFNVDDDPSYTPVLWETMIFWEPYIAKTRGRSWRDRRRVPTAPAPHEYQDRYHSTSEAIAGHARAVELVQLYRRGPRKLKKLMNRRYDAKRSSRDRLRRRYASVLSKYNL